MISKIEIRKFAVQQAVSIMGAGVPQKDVVAKAKEIEDYIIGESDIPETSSDTDAISNIMDNVVQILQDISGPEIRSEDKSFKKK